MPRRVSKPSLKERRRRARNVTVFLSCVLALSLILFIAVLARIPETRVVSVTSSAVTYASNTAIEGVVRDMLEGSHLFIIPRSHAFFIPTASIKDEIKKTFPSIQSISIKRNGLREVEVVLNEETPSYLWCASSEDSPSCFFMNSDGYVFARAHTESTPFIRFTGNIEGDPIGQRYLSEDFQSLIKGVSGIEKIVGKTVTSVDMDEHNDIAVHFIDGSYIQFVRASSYDALLENISSVFSSKKVEREQALEYADFRFGNKIYVKFREE
ncbi:hypothetical protein COU15_02520 [Candidatus Kaiserbacteria bacterium CG10_big_fil_rev_8_21_14_0_10_45_20]|uniref:POTRA domain-containing protein n=1 Tax=Candidatus Kaiserbacteria bacterium CG10_big_fil_rev_8_21_14_0_10_45_20 TaxID=1974607 RepID=A0A2H0UH24_9BACT|nr:MAG: hypothetical protein COU15_02520 [Candidatus Kaiserbacteria bacterium CG10_big_fil_rev_8_21_14_0_10_45_20]